MKPTNLTILGSTGSIGGSTLDVVDHLAPRFRVKALTAGRNVSRLVKQAKKYKPDIIVLERPEDAAQAAKHLKDESIQVLSGLNGIEEAARLEHVDLVVAAITGINGLKPTLAAVNAGKRVALANKESMVTAGFLLNQAANRSGAEIFPVDSEHSAVFQCFEKVNRRHLRKVVLTASGGPFFRLSKQEMGQKSPQEALNHPRWNMGNKVTIDSATLMNKGLELIEAMWLFQLSPDQLDVLIHPQSIVHSLVELTDGSIIAQLSTTDMRIPIQYALTYPDRMESPTAVLDLDQIRNLEFYSPDLEKFPLLRLAFQVLGEGRDSSIIFNAANEVAVQAYLNESIGFLDIHDIVAKTLVQSGRSQVETLEDIMNVDRAARQTARNLLQPR